MTIAEIEELLGLAGWTKRHLAEELSLSEDSVYRWFVTGNVPKGPTTILMRHWLTEARKGTPKMPLPSPRKEKVAS